MIVHGSIGIEQQESALTPSDGPETTACMRLWLMVLERASLDMKKLLGAKRRKPELMKDPVFRYDLKTLSRWFRSREMEEGGFAWICSLIDMDPDRALGILQKEWETDRPKRPNFFPRGTKA
ncbi:MAG: hypothetical protein HQM00_11690 [Magnetococcales bacterium]|nr:hypothetical protein [Magnetococcales bacterium]